MALFDPVSGSKIPSPCAFNVAAPRSDVVEVVAIETRLRERVEQPVPEQQAENEHGRDAASLWVRVGEDLVEVGEAHVVAEGMCYDRRQEVT